MSLEFSWSIGRLKEVLQEVGCPFSLTPTTCTPEFLKLISPLVEEQDIPEAKIGLASGVLAFIWLYACIQGYSLIVSYYCQIFSVIVRFSYLVPYVSDLSLLQWSSLLSFHLVQAWVHLPHSVSQSQLPCLHYQIL